MPNGKVRRKSQQQTEVKSRAAIIPNQQPSRISSVTLNHGNGSSSKKPSPELPLENNAKNLGHTTQELKRTPPAGTIPSAITSSEASGRNASTKWMPPRRVFLLLTLAVSGTLLALIGTSIFYSRLSPVAKEVMLATKNLIALSAAVLSVLALIESWRKPETRRAAGWLAACSAVLALAAKAIEPPPSVSREDFRRLLVFNAEKFNATIPPDMYEIAKAIDLAEKDPLRLAQSKLARDRLDESLRLFDSGLQQQSDVEQMLAEAHAGRGLVLKHLNRPREALDEADRSLAIRRTSSGLLLRCAMLRNLSQIQDALAACNEAIQIDPSSPPAWGEKGAVLLAQGQSEHHLQPSLYEEAIGALNISIRGAPQNPSPWNNKAIALHRLDRNAEALSAVDKAIELKPDFEDALLNKGTILKSLGKLDEAMEVYKELTQRNPNDDYAWNNLGDGYEAKGELSEALAAYDASLEINPHYADALFNKGQLLNRLKRQREAIVFLRKAIEESPRDFEAFYELAVALESTGDRQGAIAALANSLQINPEFKEAKVLKAQL